MRSPLLLHNLLFLLLFLLLPAFVQAQVSGQSASNLFEGVGKIEAGNTLKARQDAMETLMKSALRETVVRLGSGSRSDALAGLIERQYVDQYSRYVKNFSIVSETPEAGDYRVRARVQVDQDKLTQALRTHGLIKSTAADPKVLLFVSDLSRDKEFEVEKAWWQDSITPVAAGLLQDSLQRALKPFPLALWSRAQMARSKSVDELSAAWSSLNQGAKRFHVPDFLTIAKRFRADYVVYGKVWEDFSQVQLVVVRVEDHKRVGKLELLSNYFESNKIVEEVDRKNTIVFHLVGLILQEWLESLSKDASILVHFNGVKSLSDYRGLVKSLRSIEQISSVEEKVFQPRSISLKLESSKKAAELVALLSAHRYFDRRATFQLRDDWNIEATLE